MPTKIETLALCLLSLNARMDPNDDARLPNLCSYIQYRR